MRTLIMALVAVAACCAAPAFAQNVNRTFTVAEGSNTHLVATQNGVMVFDKTVPPGAWHVTITRLDAGQRRHRR